MIANIKKIIASPIKSSFTVFIIVATTVALLTSCWDSFSSIIFPSTVIGLYSKDFWENVLVEAHGLVLDLAVIGIIVFYLDYVRDRKASIDKYQENIDDFRHWVASEATYKIIGNIKRLNALGVSAINLSDCFLSQANLKGVNLQGANLRGAKLNDSILRKAILINAKLEGSVLVNASMRGCDMAGSNIERANCRGVNLQGACLKGASSWRADFMDGNLRSADFRNADLKEVNFTGADLRSVNFLGARNLTADQLLQAASIQDIKIDSNLRQALS